MKSYEMPCKKILDLEISKRFPAFQKKQKVQLI